MNKFVIARQSSKSSVIPEFAPNARSAFREELDVPLRKCVGDLYSWIPA